METFEDGTPGLSVDGVVDIWDVAALREAHQSGKKYGDYTKSQTQNYGGKPGASVQKADVEGLLPYIRSLGTTMVGSLYGIDTYLYGEEEVSSDLDVNVPESSSIVLFERLV